MKRPWMKYCASGAGERFGVMEFKDAAARVLEKD
jgi:hypothetical protein